MPHIEWHFATSDPEWASIAPRKRNVWQRLAAATKGVVTPGNIASALGLMLVTVGLAAMWHKQYWIGLILIALGRLLDIADGMLAHKTGTKGPLGEAVDATCDKIGAFATLVVFAGTTLLWWPAALLIGLQNLFTTSIALIAKHQRYGLHPSAVGKVATGGEWLALVGFSLAAALGFGHTSGLGMGSYTVLAISLGLSAYAALGYFRLFLNARSRRPQ